MRKRGLIAEGGLSGDGSVYFKIKHFSFDNSAILSYMS